MKKIQSLETIVKSQDVLKDELINIKGGLKATEPITCQNGKVKCKTGNDNTTALSVW